jgi:ribosomal protein S18 acetylase RimI-like enzyme
MVPTPATSAPEGRRPALPHRVWKALRQEGPAGLWWRLRKRLYDHKEILVAVRDNDAPLPRAVERLQAPGSTRLATPEDAALWDPVRPDLSAQVRKWLADPACGAVIFLSEEGHLLSFGWFHIGPMYEPSLAHTFDPGPDGAYWFNGWALPEWRGRGIALLGMNYLFGEVFRERGIRQVMVYYEADNRQSRRLHQRYRFREIQRIQHYRLGPFRWNRVEPLEAEAGAGATATP